MSPAGRSSLGVVPRLARGYRRLSRSRPRGVTLAACLSAVVIAGIALWRPGQTVPAVDMSVGQAFRVGVEQGGSIPGYVRSSGAELAVLPESGSAVHALVAFDAYLPPDRLARVLGGVEVAAVYVRVPLERTQTEIVKVPATRLPEDLLTGMDALVARKREEADEYRRRLGTDPGAELTRVFEAGARIADAEAMAYAARCSCAYAAVVRGTPDALRRLAGRQGVRVVDPAPELRRLDRAVFLPPLPEQRDRAEPISDHA